MRRPWKTMGQLRHVTEEFSRTGIPAWWPALFDAAANASPFLSPAYVEVWVEVFSAPFSGQWVSWYDGDTCVAGTVLLSRRSKRGPVPVHLLVIGTGAEDGENSPWVEYHDVLCRAGYEDRVAASLADILATMPWDRLYLPGFAADSVLERLFNGPLPGARDSYARPSLFVPLAGGGAESYERALSRNTRSQLRRSLKLYGERGAVEITPAANPDEAAVFMGELGELHRALWRRRGSGGGFRTDEIMRFHRALIARGQAASHIDMVRASAGGTAIGYLYNLVHRGKVYFYQSGFEYEADAKLKPGLCTHALAIEHYGARGFSEYDFLAGDARYKRSLAQGERELHWAWIDRPNARMKTVNAAVGIKHWLEQRMGRDHGGAESEDE
ncbi:MAG: GNAT family N-acetyltransferase [Burkholderiaceae bacterium]|nr:GNAT family N-acetyltransferase [Burkholderiaceae bacterium]